MKRIVIILTLVLAILTGITFTKTVRADDTSAKKSYSIQAVMPENQLDKNLTYYDIQSKPNFQQNLELVVFNTGTESIDVNVELNNAYTADAATIGYEKFSAKTYNNPNPELTLLVQGSRRQKVKLAAGSTKKVIFKIKNPAKPFQGIILGGITTTASVDTSSNQNIDVSNQIRYVKGVVLHSKADPITPNMNLLSAAPRSINHDVGLGFRLSNEAPVNINDVQVKAKINHKGMKTIKYSADKLQIAPNTKFDYFIPIKHLEPGSYTSEITFSSKSGYSKTFHNKLQVTQGKIQALDESMQERSSNKFWIIVILSLVAILVAGLWLFMYATGKKIGLKRSIESEDIE